MIAKKCIHIAFSPMPLLLLSFFISKYLFIFFLMLQIFFIFFFRDIKRKIHEGIISPADGRIIENDGKISIFMNLFDMHVNLMPYDGKISKIKHYRGKHLPAYKNVDANHRVEIEIESDIGKIKVVQIAGFFARRIITYVNEGDYLRKGEKIGIIRFGSRVELFLPESCEIIVKRGERIKGGQTVAITKYKNLV